MILSGQAGMPVLPVIRDSIGFSDIPQSTNA